MSDRKSTLGKSFNPLKSFFIKGGLGIIPLEEAMELYDFTDVFANRPIDDLEEKQKFLDEIDEIARKYLNPKERCIYYLVIHEKKRTSDIAVILNYNGWRTTQNSIDRVFKILNLYSNYEKINKETLEKSLHENYSKLELKVIRLLYERYTIHQISKKLGKKFHYTKSQALIKSILARMEEFEGELKEYHDFLVNIRKFKDSCRFDEGNDRVFVKDDLSVK